MLVIKSTDYLLYNSLLCSLLYLRSVTLGIGFGGPAFTGVALGEDCSVFEGSGGGVSCPIVTCLFELSLSEALVGSPNRIFKALFWGSLFKSGSLTSVS